MFLKNDSYAQGQVVDKSDPARILTAAEVGQLTPENKRSRTAMEASLYNLKQFYEGADEKELNAPGALSKYKMSGDGGSILLAATSVAINLSGERPVVTWTDDIGRKSADRYLSDDYGNGSDGNGIWASRTAHDWVGRGLRQVTHPANYADFFLYLANNNPSLLPSELSGVAKTVAAFKQKLKNSPSIAESSAADTPDGRTLAALSAGWFWGTNNAKPSASVKLNDAALTIEWGNSEVLDDQESEFNKISKGIGGTELEKRWKNYQSVLKKC